MKDKKTCLYCEHYAQIWDRNGDDSYSYMVCQFTDYEVGKNPNDTCENFKLDEDGNEQIL